MPLLSFITDKNLEDEVRNIISCAETARSNANGKKFGKNVIDPFGILFEMGGFYLNHQEWLNNERIRQAQKTLQNAVGAFHQNLIGRMVGWQNPGAAGIVDAVNTEKRIVAEIKNKHNTVKGDNQKDLYDTLENAVAFKNSKYYEYTAYYVAVIPKKSERYNAPFTPSDNKKGQRRPENPLIRQIDGYSFYALATGVEDALDQLFKALPVVMNSLGRNINTDDKAFAQNFFDKAFL